jgi:lipoprotein-anchoring transpeptidase ErfK/SrfK
LISKFRLKICDQTKFALIHSCQLIKLKPMNRLLYIACCVGLLGFAGCSEFENAMYDMRGLPPGKIRVVVDLSEQRAYLTAGGEPILSSPISAGREGHNTKPGQYTIIQKDLDHHSSVYGAYVDRASHAVVKRDIDTRKDPQPPGTVFVGAPMPYFMRIYGGVGMHEGYLPGYPASHGCIRMPEAKAKRFYAVVKVGTPVKVIE